MRHRRRPSPAPTGAFRPALLAVSLCSAFGAGAQNSTLPTGPQVIAGQATFATQGNQLLVTTQNAAGRQHSAINWQSFSIGAGASAYFQQPGASSTVINRVVAPNPSQLLGTLGSNGHLVLVNPYGIAAGRDAVVDTARFTASTLSMSEADAVAGRLRFQASTGPAALNVQGQVLARGGDVVLISPDIEVGAEAKVQAQGGAVVLAAGQKVEVTGRGLEGIVLEVQAPTDRAVNLGTLSGDAVGIFAGTLRHSGVIQAQTAALEGGRVVLRAQKSLEVTPGAKILADGAAGQPGGHVTISAGEQAQVAGVVSAQSPALPSTVTLPASAETAPALPPGTGQGGRVEILGRLVELQAGAAVDVSGDLGGGVILVGGDLQGRNPDIPNAAETRVAPGVALVANARAYGDGGKVIVWADEATHFQGHLSARGGEQGGNGGFGETSGRNVLYFGGTADLTARRGRRGTLLLDPANINVGAVANINGDGSTGDNISAPGDLDNAGTDFPGANSEITAAALASLLDTTNVTLAATNAITINSPVNKTGAPATTLTLTATTVTINSSVASSGGALNLALDASGTATLNSRYANGTLTSTNGALVMGGSAVLDGVTIGGNLAVSGAFSILNGLTLANGITLNGGNSTWYFYGTQTVGTSGAATIQRAGGSTYVNTGNTGETVTFGSGITWSGYGGLYEYYGGGGLVNNGLIDFNVAGQNSYINPANVTNNGVVRLVTGNLQLYSGSSFTNAAAATLANAGGVMTLDRAIANSGALLLTGGTTNFGGQMTPANFGAGFSRTAGALNLTGTLDLGGGSVNIGSGGLFGTGGLSALNSGTIKNGTLVSSDGTTLNSSSGTLDGMTIGGNLSMNNGSSNLRNNLWLAAGSTLNIGSHGFYGYGNQTVGPVSGTATVTSAGGYLYANVGNAGETMTLGSGLTWQGYGGLYQYYGGASLVNNGVIDANVAGQAIYLNPDNITNNGLMRTSGGILQVSAPGTFTNSATGTILNAGGTLTLDRAISNSGTLSTTAGTTNMGGQLTPASFGTGWSRTGGLVNLTGTLDLGGGSLDIGSGGIFGTGGLSALNYPGTVKNGTVVSGDGTTFNSSGGTLDGLTIGSNLSLNGGTSNVRNNLLLAPGITLNIGSHGLYAYGNQSVAPASGTATVTSAGGYIYINVGNASEAVTFGSGLTWQGYGGLYEYYGGSSLVNNGVIDANVPGQSLYANPGSFANNGIVRTTGGTLYLYTGSNFINAPGATLLNAGGTMTLERPITNSGAFLVTAGTTNLGGAMTPANFSTGGRARAASST